MAGVLVRRAFLSPVIQEICERLASTEFRVNFREELVKKLEITGQSINKVLDDAETKQYEDLEVKNWLDNVSNEIYEVEKVLDVIATDVAQQKGKIRRFLSASINRFESRIKVLLKRLEFLAFEKHSLGLDELTSNYCEVGARDFATSSFMDLSIIYGREREKEEIINFLHSDSYNRNQVSRGSIKILLQRLECVAFNEHCLGLDELTSNYYEDGPSDFATSSFMDESIIYGREREKEEIINFLLSDSYNRNQVSIVSIVGLKGMGKTALAQLVYNDHRIQEQFELKAWVHLSESFDCLRPIKEIRDLQLQHGRAGNKYLVVLDDARINNRNTLQLLLLLINKESFRGKMIVTTNDKEVASVMRSTRIFHLRQLEESDSWSLFVRHAFEGRNMFEYPNHESIGKKIVEKCGGLPLALKTMGILVQRKFSENEWVKILETDLWRLSKGDSSNIYSALRMSYLCLPSNLKHCFSYCSIFPKGYEFEKDGLIKLWMAEGLLKCWGRFKTEEELGNEFFNDLVSISFFQQSAIMPFWAGKFYFIMHDLVHDLATSMSGEFCLRIDGVKVQDIPQRTRHIWCCLDLEDGGRKLKQIHNIKGLQSLMVAGQGYGEKRFKISTNVQQSLFSRLKYLRILSFSGCNLLELADEIRNLKLLRYLDLSYTEITSLPTSICMLYNLHTLLLEECFKLTELPSNFCKFERHTY